MRKFVITAAASLIGLSTIAAANAQTNPYARRDTAPRESYGSFRVQRDVQSRSAGPYSVPENYGGTIRWNTPNADGNFGGPGAGGSGGNFGG
jgi:hypothetical protein